MPTTIINKTNNLFLIKLNGWDFDAENVKT